MGLIQHHAILASTWDNERYEDFLKWLTSEPLSESQKQQLLAQNNPGTNGYCTVVVCPDGSKEGWDESTAGNLLRDRILLKLASYDYDDGSSPWDVVEVSFGEQGAFIQRSNCKDVMSGNRPDPQPLTAEGLTPLP